MISVGICSCQCTIIPEWVINLGGITDQFARNKCSTSPVSLSTKNGIFIPEFGKTKSRAGVYFLLGEDEETGKGIVYIGQAIHRKNGEGLVNRFKEHMKDPNKDYWNEAIIVTTVDDRLGPTEISYLEHSFCSKAISANRYIVKNGNDPNIGHPSEEMQDALDDFIRTTELIIGYAQHKVFEPLIEYSADEDLLLFSYSSASGKGKITSDGFVVMKDSKLRRE